jgi:hypothetical protein
MDDRVEIWSPEEHARVAAMDSNVFADLANDVMGGGAEGVGDIEL